MFQMLALHHGLIFVFPTPAILSLWAAMTTISVSENYRWKIRWTKWGWQYLKGKESFKTNQPKKGKGDSYNKTRINMLHVKKKSTCWPASTTSWGGISSVPISRTNNLESSFTCDISQRINPYLKVIIICTHSSC